MHQSIKILNTQQQEACVLTKALCNAANRLGLAQRELATLVGVSEATGSRLYQGKKLISPREKTGELALLLIRSFRSLSAILGGDPEKCRLWFHSENAHLGGIPARLVLRTEGLVAVTNYLDVMRGKL